MSAGHIAMAFDRSFLIALLLLIVGSGLLKGNIAAQVGGLYPPEDETRRTHGYVLFSTGINVGAIIGQCSAGSCAVLRLALRLWHRGALHVDWACYVPSWIPSICPAGGAFDTPR